MQFKQKVLYMIFGGLVVIVLQIVLYYIGERATAQSSPFTVNVNRNDPYKQFKFRIKWDGQYVAGVSEVSGLERTTEIKEFRGGSEPSLIRKMPGTTTYAPIVLTRGRTHDTAFEAWANQTWQLGASGGAEVSLKNFRKDIYIELLNEAGQIVMGFKVYRCWPEQYVALGDLDANSNDVVIESITLAHEGWERDTDVTEPEEPSFIRPVVPLRKER